MELTTGNTITNTEPITHEFYIMDINTANKRYRKYPLDIVNKWIDDLNNQKVKFYKIENVIHNDEKEVKKEYIKESLYCGMVNKLEIKNNKLYAHAIFKTKGQFANEIRASANFFDDLTLTPKGKGKIKLQSVCDYTLICFNLVQKTRSAFFKDIT